MRVTSRRKYPDQLWHSFNVHGDLLVVLTCKQNYFVHDIECMKHLSVSILK